MDETTFEDLAFLSHPWREPDEVGPEDCLSTAYSIVRKGESRDSGCNEGQRGAVPQGREG